MHRRPSPTFIQLNDDITKEPASIDTGGWQTVRPAARKQEACTRSSTRIKSEPMHHYEETKEFVTYS